MRPIQELYGLGVDISTVPNTTVGGFDKGNQTQDTAGLTPVDVDQWATSKWQKMIQDAFESKQSMIILASPAAGKTKPLMNGFIAVLLKAMESMSKGRLTSKSVHFPRMIFVTPRTQLATQMYDDFISDVLIPVILNISGLNENHRLTPFQQKSMIETIQKNYISLVSGPGGNTKSVSSDLFGKKPIVVATYNHAAKIISESGNFYNYILVDELQEYLPNPGKPIEVTPNIIESLVNIVDHGMQRQNTLILATGSVHITSLNEFKSYLEQKYNKRILMRSSFQTNRSKLSLIPFSEMRNSSELASLIKKLASANMTGNLIITFAKKEKPLSNLSILSTAREITKLLPIVHKSWLVTATKERDMTAKAFAKSIGEVPISSKELTDGPESLVFFDLNKVMERRDETSQSANGVAQEDPNNLLFQAVIRGVGFIVGGMEDSHKRTVQSLFRAGKLHTVIASDAVGVGANVLAQRLFLPDLHKFESGVFGQVNTSNLIQLINRAGRDVSRVPFAAVYLQPKDIEVARDLISKHPVIAAGEIDVSIVLDRFENIGDKYTVGQKISNLFKRVFLSKGEGN